MSDKVFIGKYLNLLSLTKSLMLAHYFYATNSIFHCMFSPVKQDSKRLL